MSLDRACVTCRFWVEINERMPQPGGYCHRMPASGVGWAVWPITRTTDWCGEWLHRKGK